MKQPDTTQHVILLTADEVSQVGGGSATASGPPRQDLNLPPLQAEDAYGDTMSGWDYMDWTAVPHDPVNGDSIHDFPGGRGRQ